MKKLLFILLLLLSPMANAQTLEGHLKHHAGQELSLTGFNYYSNYALAKTTADSLGNFTLNYPKDYKGMAILQSQDNSSLVVALTEPNIHIRGTHLAEVDSLQFADHSKNKQFNTLVKGYSQRAQAYQAWRYLQPKYNEQAPLNAQKKVAELINNELKRLDSADVLAVNNLPKDSYLKWFVPVRKLINDMPQTARSYTERIPQHIQQFRTTDFTTPKFKTSGLFRELIEGHYLLLENMGQSLDSIYIQMNVSTDYLLKNVTPNKPLLTTVSKELFTYFEKRSLFKAASYLSESLINQHVEVLDSELRSKMERYVSLKVGTTAPDVQLTPTKKLSDTGNNILLVFGSSECGYCLDDKKKLETYYSKWQSEGTLELVYISIDTNKALFDQTYSNTPWQTYCDLKGWNTQGAKDYFVNATPTYVVLDKDLKILLHPKSVEHVEAWVSVNL